MQCTVQVVVEIGEEVGVNGIEAAVREAGRQAMRQAVGQAVRAYEALHPACPRCGSVQSQSQGTVRRHLLTGFGPVTVALRRHRCGVCGRRFRPARGCLAEMGRGRVTAELAAACALAGASWPYATAAQVLHRLSGAQVSAEEVRRQTIQAGTQEAAAQQAEAERQLQPTAADVHAERDAQDRAARQAREQAARQARRVRAGQPAPPAAVPPAAPEQLTAGMDGGWVASREQAGGMEGKVAVVATGTQPVGQHGRHRLTPRRYVATFESSEQLGRLAAGAAVALSGYAAGRQAVLGDGAAWIKTQAEQYFPDARGILDWSHLARAVHRAIRAACAGPAQRARRHELHQAIPAALWHGEVEAALAQLRALRPSAPDAPPCARLEETIAYVDGQRAWLGDYAAWQEAGYPVGSGLIERAVAVVINWRMKRRGMRWRRPNASAVVALRVRTLNADGEVTDRLAPLAA
jgi:hypothetical protein